MKQKLYLMVFHYKVGCLDLILFISSNLRENTQKNTTRIGKTNIENRTMSWSRTSLATRVWFRKIKAFILNFKSIANRLKVWICLFYEVGFEWLGHFLISISVLYSHHQFRKMCPLTNRLVDDKQSNKKKPLSRKRWRIRQWSNQKDRQKTSSALVVVSFC